MADEAPFNKDGTVKRSALRGLKQWERMKLREELADDLRAAKDSGDIDRRNEAASRLDAWRTVEREEAYASEDPDVTAARPETVRATAKAQSTNPPKGD